MEKEHSGCGCIIGLLVAAWILMVMFDENSHFGAKYGTLGEITYWTVIIIACIVIVGSWWLSRK